MLKRVTLADVAREAGVSVQTASHVLSGNPTVRLPERTREAVRAAASKVGYRPNRLAQAMKLGRTQVIAIWLPVERPAVNYLRFISALNDRALESGYELMISGIATKMAYAAEGRLPTQWPVDGLIALDAGKAVRAFRAEPQNDVTPVAVLGLEEYANSDAIAWDVLSASRQATEQLIGRGAKRIAHVTPDWVLSDFPREQRRRGYTEAMEAAGLAPEFIASPAETGAAASAAVSDFIAANGVPDAFFGFSDTFAIGASRALLRAGIEVPKDCMLWGFGDHPEGEDHRVPISTIQMPVHQVVGQAWTWLLERIEDPDLPHRKANLPMPLIERDSSRRDR